MAKKGKYQLLSYLIDGYLVFYKSLNRNKKLIAFALFETNSYEPAIAILNEFLKKRYIHYYSIQVSTIKKSTKIFLLSFEEIKKERILQSFNFIQQSLIKKKGPFKFLKDHILEQKYLEVILKKTNSNISQSKPKKSIIVGTNDNDLLLNFYSINLEYVNNKKSFLHNFINIINNYNRKGYVIFNFIIDNDDKIKFCLYFVEIVMDRNDQYNTEENVNNFFNFNLLNKQLIKLKEIFNYVWRKGILNSYFLLTSFHHIFFVKNQHELFSLLNFNREFEQTLIKNGIEYMRFNQNFLFIEQAFLFLVLQKVKPDYIRQVIKKYYPKYVIYILIIDTQEYEKLLNIENLSSLKNIFTLKLDEFSNFDFNKFKDQLKDS
jgi:hypothetical protein